MGGFPLPKAVKSSCIVRIDDLIFGLGAGDGIVPVIVFGAGGEKITGPVGDGWGGFNGEGGGAGGRAGDGGIFPVGKFGGGILRSKPEDWF